MRSPCPRLRHAVLLAPLTLAAGLQAQVVLEKPGDPPRAPAARSPSPSAVSSVKYGPFVSTQVNVDKNGNNITGDAANEPSIVIDPTDPKKIVIGWRQFDNVRSNFRQNGYSWSHDGGKSWTFPGAIQPNVFNSDPVLDADVNGKLYYLSYPGGRTMKLFRSGDGGKSWTGPTNLTGGDKPWMIVDRSTSTGRGFIYAIWQVAHGPNTFVRSIDGGNSFSSAVYVPSTPTFGTLATDAAGNVYACGLRRQNFGSFVISKSTNAKDKNATPTFTTRSVNMGGRMGINGSPNPGGLLGQAQVVTDPSRANYVYMLCSVNPSGSDPLDVHLVRSTNGGTTFSSPVRINDDPSTSYAWQWHGTLSIAPNGRLDVVWNDTRGSSSTISQTYYSWSSDAGVTWSKNVAIGPKWNSVIGWPNQNKIGDYYHMRSDKAAAHLAYATTYNGEQDVYYTRLGDCNDNGVHDGDDIKNGTSFDSNKNTIPDECEFCQKDLGNGKDLLLRICGDDLTQAQSVATFDLSGGPASSPVLVALSAARFAQPIPLPGGGALVPDLTNPVSVLFAGYVTNSKGRLGAAWPGGSKPPVTIYAQAFQFKGSSLMVSNAVEARIGLP